MSEQKLEAPEIELITGSTYRIGHYNGDVTIISTGNRDYPYEDDTLVWEIEKSSGHDDLAIKALQSFFLEMEEFARMTATEDMDDEFYNNLTYEF